VVCPYKEILGKKKELKLRAGVVACTYSPHYWGSSGHKITEPKSSRAAWVTQKEPAERRGKWGEGREEGKERRK
jgi:hypothetical protein